MNRSLKLPNGVIRTPLLQVQQPQLLMRTCIAWRAPHRFLKAFYRLVRLVVAAQAVSFLKQACQHARTAVIVQGCSHGQGYDQDWDDHHRL
jgi:hypothetical protein